jgi:hypothetical protein
MLSLTSVLALSGGVALGATPPPQHGSFAFEDQFTTQPGDPASCSFPMAVDVQVRGTFTVSTDAQGEPTRLLVHNHWTGTVSANGRAVIEHAAQNEVIDLVTGTSTNAGQIHDQALAGGVVIHDVGLLRFDADGNLTFLAGPHQGFAGDVSGLCAALA